MAEGVNSSFNREESTDAFERAEPTEQAKRNKSTNPFVDDSEEDVDDELFLLGAKKSCFETKNEAKNVETRISEIRQETLASTERSLAHLVEAEQVGDKITETMAHQKEQLENCNRKMDDIDANLKSSRKHLRRIRSIFGGMRDFLLGTKVKKSPKPFEGSNKPMTVKEEPKPVDYEKKIYDSNSVQLTENLTKFDGDNDEKEELLIERNLSHMLNHVAGLKSRAIDIGDELDVQSDLIDSINDKTEVANISLAKQNKDIEKLLV